MLTVINPCLTRTARLRTSVVVQASTSKGDRGFGARPATPGSAKKMQAKKMQAKEKAVPDKQSGAAQPQVKLAPPAPAPPSVDDAPVVPAPETLPPPAPAAEVASAPEAATSVTKKAPEAPVVDAIEQAIVQEQPAKEDKETSVKKETGEQQEAAVAAVKETSVKKETGEQQKVVPAGAAAVKETSVTEQEVEEKETLVNKEEAAPVAAVKKEEAPVKKEEAAAPVAAVKQEEAPMKVQPVNTTVKAPTTSLPPSVEQAMSMLTRAGPQISSQDASSFLEELKDTSRLGQRGELYFVAQLVLFGLVIFPPHAALDGVMDVLGWASIAIGGVMIVAAQQALGKNLTPLPEPRPSNTLVTSGVYALARHPMYGALVLAALGWAAISGDGLRFVMSGVLFLVLDRKSNFEEQALTKRHGKEYEEYKRSSKKLIPWIY